MNKQEFLALMNFPKEWDLWGMYPDELFQGHLALYKKGDEKGSEHDRNGAFHWWLKQDPSIEILKKLLELTYLEPEKYVAEDIRKYIRNSKYYSASIESNK